MNSSPYETNSLQPQNRVEIGVIQSNTQIPFPVGAIGNQHSFVYPVRYQFVEELTAQRLIVNADPTLDVPIIKAAKTLERSGVSAIIGDCGHMIQFQQAVKDSVNIPVFLSSWLQLPFIRSILPSSKQIGVIMANGQFFRRKFLTAVGIDQSIVLHIIGMENQPAFRKAYIDESGQIDYKAVENELLETARNFVYTQPKIGALLLECSDMPPYANKIRQEVKIPVFDYLTMANYVYSTLDR